MGHPEIENVRQGKFFEVDVADRLSPGEASQMMKKIAEEVLSNPVIEEYRVEIAS
jgi:phosphoribosylformylglycinamidine synthase